MNLESYLVALLFSLLPITAMAETPYTCYNNTEMTYEASVILQTVIVAKFSKWGPDGVNLAEGSWCQVADLDGVNGTAYACVWDTSKIALTTSGQVQSAFGQLLSGCTSRGMSGQIVLDNTIYGIGV